MATLVVHFNDLLESVVEKNLLMKKVVERWPDVSKYAKQIGFMTMLL